MRKILITMFLATAAMPAFAQSADQNDGRNHDRGAARAERGQAQAARPERATERRAPNANAYERAAPQASIEQRSMSSDRGQWQRPATNVQPQNGANWQRNQRVAPAYQNGQTWGGNRDVRQIQDRQIQDRQVRGDQVRGDQYSGRQYQSNGYRGGQYQANPYRNGQYDNRQYQARRDTSRNWNQDWRRDRRYDWRDYRNENRSLFRVGIYYDPYGYGYRQPYVGWNLNANYYQSNYWIDDTDMYRLPPAYGPYRWVRYYNDALLVDTYSGQVVDVISGFFW